MSKKWYNFFVSVDQLQQQEGTGQPGDRSAAQTVAELAAALGEPPQPVAMPGFAPPPAAPPIPRTPPGGTGPGPATPVPAGVPAPASFQDLYEAAEILPPPHGFTIMKISDLLQSEHIRNLPREVKRSSILLALEASGARIEEVIQDAIKRDRALDTFERVQQQSLADLETRKNQENQQIQAELDRLIAEHKARMQANTGEVAQERERFYGWRLKKQEEEQKIADAVSYFVTENPITTRPASPAGIDPARSATAAPSGASSPKPAPKAGE